MTETDVLIVLVFGALLLYWVARKVIGRRVRRTSQFVERVHLDGTKVYEVAVVGESHYLPALRTIAGPGEVRHECEAELRLQDDNPHDAMAVQVRIDGMVVGHLSREDARAYREQFAAPGRYPAVIVGGGEGRENLGIWLDLPAD